MMIEPRRELKYVRFQNGGGLVGKPRLAPMSRTPRSEPKVVKPPPVQQSPRLKDALSPRELADGTIWRPQRDELLTDDLKEKLRPVLDHRMPTLVTKGAFGHGKISAIQPGPSGLDELLDAPPRNMRDVRASINKELKTLSKRLARVERAYYGEKGNVNSEAERYVHSIKKLMKSLMVFDLNHAAAIDDLLSLASNPARYSGEPKYVADIKEIYTKVQTFLPDKLTNIIESCQSLLHNVSRYCVSFYEPDTDCYLETADHYSEQIESWKEKADVSIQSARSLYKRFKSSGITIKMLSSPVATYSSRNSLQRVLFVVLFADACTHLKNAIEVMRGWVKADENYATYVKNDLTELEALREEKTRNLREYRQRYHSLTFKLTQLEADYRKLAVDVNALREKEGMMRIEEVFLVNQHNDVEREIEVKERRRDLLKRQTPVLGPAPSPEPLLETIESLTSDVKHQQFIVTPQSLKDQLPLISRQLAALRTKLGWVDDKIVTLDKVSKDIFAVKKELKQVEADRARKEKEFAEVERAVSVARRVLMCKTANDSVEKLYYSMPIAVKAAKVTKAKDDPTTDPVDRACKIITGRIDRDWVNLYRSLPFHPQRGSETIGQDIVTICDSGGRVNVELLAKRSLDRWRRYHTRASVDDLRQSLKKIKRSDILKVIDIDLNPPPKIVQALCEVQEEAPPPVEPHLIPFYKQIERYDQLRASRLAEAQTGKRRVTKSKSVKV